MKGIINTTKFIMYNPIEKYHIFRTVTQSNRKIPHCQNSYTIQSQNTTLSEQLHNPIKKYHTVRTVTQSNRKNTTLSEQLHKPIEKYHIVRTVTQSNRQTIQR